MIRTMRALLGGDGPDWDLREIDVPTPRPGQILIRVHAAGLNRADLLMLDGTYPRVKTSRVFTAGLELSGEVESVGADVENVAVGHRVMGGGRGAFAEFALLDHRHVITVPDSLNWTEAAALPIGLTTEHDALVTQGQFAAGQRVLVVGATSGVGLLGIQLARALGASLVIATTTSDSKASALAEAGANVVINTRTENLPEVVNNATGGSGVDIVLDHVGGQLFADTLLATRIGGTIINIGRLAGSQSTINLDQLSYRRLRVRGTTFSVRTPDEVAEVYAALVPDVLPALADGSIRPIVNRVFALDEAKQAAEYMRSHQAVGKIVLNVQ
jgi:NADPH2:quinone reductase